ncbi:methylation-associated defense system ATP-binding protein MAD8 [Kribbella yunnanensis]|uniref:methylation-associated defense system ATP-binding protein MAD8 n=1 Tax=Kribbella yunnanensis TaxID=190194 RepID=UPI003CD09695
MPAVGLTEPTAADVRSALEEVLVPHLLGLLSARQPGHCMRVTELDGGLSSRLVTRLRTATMPGTVVCLLAADEEVANGDDTLVTSTQLVELRNRPVNESSGPLLVFVPPGLRASAEDSFGVATFEEIEVGNAYTMLREELMGRIPAALRDKLGKLATILGGKKDGRSTDQAWVRYLLTVAANDYEVDAAGAAVYCFGLVPDLALFTSGDEVPERVGRNRVHVDDLSRGEIDERQRVLSLGLPDLSFTASLARFAGKVGLEDRNVWTRRIIIDRDSRGLTFDKWPAPSEREIALKVDVHTIALPVVGDDPGHLKRYPTLERLAGQPYLIAGPSGAKDVAVAFTVDPALTPTDGLLKLRVELVSEDGTPTGKAINVTAGARPKSAYKGTIRNLRKAQLDEGWHRLMVTPIAETDRRIVVATGSGQSELFYVVNADDDEEPPETRAQRHESLTHAIERLSFGRLVDGRPERELTPGEASWVIGSRSSSYASANIHVPGGGSVEIRLSRLLTQIERDTLISPRELGIWQLALGQEGAPSAPVRDETPWVDALGPAAEGAFGEFIDVRDALFAAIAKVDGRDESEPIGVVETVYVPALSAEMTAYAASFQKMIAEQAAYASSVTASEQGAALRALAGLQQIDAVAVRYLDALGNFHRILLVGPTHPLRLLWVSGWCGVASTWRKELAEHTKEAAADAEASFFDRLDPLGFPFAVPRQDNHALLVAVGNLTPFWTVLVHPRTDDAVGLLNRVGTALGVPDVPRTGSSGAQAAVVLAERVERYVRQHSYVRTLVINVINPGDAGLIVEMLLDLQLRAATKELTYDLRLCTPQTAMPGIGEQLAELTRSDSRFNSDEADAFSARGGSSVPKLAYSIRSMEEFEERPSEFEAHLTIFVDAFSGEEHETGPLNEIAHPPAYGLVQHATTAFDVNDDGTSVTWRKTPVFARPGSAANSLGDLLAELPRTLALASASVATDGTASGHVPTTTLNLDGQQRSLLHQAHDVSDWVVIIDRTLGLEYFDRATDATRRSDFVIDYIAGRVGLGRQVLVSSRKIEELRGLLTAVVSDHGVAVEDRHLRTFFEQLRLLSGSLAFKLSSAARNQRSEVLGLALARLYLEGQRALGDQIVIPLDAHQELYAEARRRPAVERSLRRTDLALISFDAKARTITCRLVEVKAYSAIRNVTDYGVLQQSIIDQVETSRAVLAAQFDPNMHDPDRVDRAVKNVEFAELLRFYLERAERYEMVGRSVSTHARRLLQTLDDGFTLSFERIGLIFELAGDGSEPEIVDGVEFHHIGRDEIDELLDAIPTNLDRPGDGTESYATTVPALTRTRREDAAFRAAPLEAIDDVAPAEADEVQTSRSGQAWQEPLKGTPTAPTVLTTGATAESVAASVASVTSGEQATGSEPRDAEKPQDAVPSILVGTNGTSPQWAMLGEVAGGQKTGLDLNETHTISLFGVQGGGKSYTLGSLIEGATLPASGINELPRPLATIVFHYSRTQDYAPEFTSMIEPNDQNAQLAILRNRYGAEPTALEDVVLLTPVAQMVERRAEFPGVDVQPLLFGSEELQAAHWSFLLGAVGNQAMYIRQLKQIFRANRTSLSLDTIRRGVGASTMADNMKDLAFQRLDLAAEYIDDSVRISDYVRPGRLIIVDLRDEYIEKDESLGLFVVLMQLFAEATDTDGRFNKLVVFDEAHKYIDSPDLVDVLVESVREMRHKGMSILVASQDPPSVPTSLIELSDVVIMHKMTSPAWLKHIQKANSALTALRPEQLARLQPGEAYVWAGKASVSAITHSAVRMTLRPRITKHGGQTKTATG